MQPIHLMATGIGCSGVRFRGSPCCFVVRLNLSGGPHCGGPVRLAPSRRSRRTSRFEGQTSANKGLKKKVLQLFPKFTYDSSSVAAAMTVDCAICLEKYADGDEIRVLPQCGHGFHVPCIDAWLGSHSSCPSCRQILAVAPSRECGDIQETSDAGDAITGPAETELKSRQDRFAASSSVGFLP
ncbi:RING-H2 finger protein ATL8 [Forsythia ovata]|uniref:RING-H2 finger protein ATL8 n=1 Tax=Forsythia ovata TaxID=205694 RepID=A0ABD1PVF8_9LAMI